jgi:hypothetical protein
MVRVSTIHDDPLFHRRQTRAYAKEATCVVKANTKVGHSSCQLALLQLLQYLRITSVHHVIEVVDNVVNSNAGKSISRATAKMLYSSATFRSWNEVEYTFANFVSCLVLIAYPAVKTTATPVTAWKDVVTRSTKLSMAYKYSNE